MPRHGMAGELRPARGVGGGLLSALPASLPPRLLQVIQKLVFPFSRTNYRPANHPELFPRLEALLLRRAAASPLATVNILMSLVQLQHFPLPVLHKVFAPAFLHDVTGKAGGRGGAASGRAVPPTTRMAGHLEALGGKGLFHWREGVSALVVSLTFLKNIIHLPH